VLVQLLLLPLVVAVAVVTNTAVLAEILLLVLYQLDTVAVMVVAVDTVPLTQV
jgi:hypothetical protein